MPTTPGNARNTALAYGAVGVSDIDRSLWFYCDVLGFRLVGSSPLGVNGARAYHLSTEGGGIDLLTLGGPRQASDWIRDDLQVGVRHIGLKVDDTDEWAARLHGLGTPFWLEPLDAFGKVRIAFFEDPDGANLEIVQGYVQYNKVWDEPLVEQERAVAPPGPATVRFDHIAVSTTNLDATIEFYEKAFGFQVVGQLLRDDDPRGFTITYLRGVSGVLEVFTFSAPMQGCPWAPGVAVTGLRHLGMRAEDVRATRLGAEAAGAKLVSETARGAGGVSSMLTDPDGVPVQLVAGA